MGAAGFACSRRSVGALTFSTYLLGTIAARVEKGNSDIFMHGISRSLSIPALEAVGIGFWRDSSEKGEE